MRKAILVSIATLLSSTQVLAEEAANAANHAAGMGDKGLFAIGLAIMLGLTAFGATMGQSRVGASAMEGLARNPQARNAMFVPMIVVLALIESLFILTWLIAQTVAGKLG